MTGEAAMQGTQRRRQRGAIACRVCGDEPTRLFRVKTSEGGPWVVSCPICAARISEDNPHFVYGGRVGRRPKRASA
ncbi:MAG: hypothetical protein R3B57_01200 [Phycisphaerales bacterium]